MAVAAEMEGSRIRLLVDVFERREAKGLLGMTVMPDVEAVNESRRESLLDRSALTSIFVS